MQNKIIDNSLSTHDTYHPELRRPLREALEIVAEIADNIDWSIEHTPSVLADILKDIQSKHNTCVDFERDFVSIALSIATGVGKTRLMGAIMTHLFLTGKSRNFFVLAPNLTIYEKLIQDFGNPAYAKYAFKGIAELAHAQPVVITGDNYAQASGLFAKQEMRINIFNISKFNKDSVESATGKKTGLPRLKRLSEYLGQSYWKYLTELDDLVILMDEAHRYHADKSKKVINELKPKFGIELTATPFVPKNGNAIADKESDKANLFKNIVYEYSLAAALSEGKYIKEPAIATRENFSKEGKSEEDIERIKLEDAISVHEKTKVELQRFALEMGRKEVKPFILVVCKDTTHAREVYEYVTSRQFFSGAYADKALQIDSTTRTTEDIEKQFVSLENVNNPIEIVIHVNMLKEGWDVSNLFTIVPLRAARALTLIEQTIGRGLRLPYGVRVDDKYVDTLTLISHEHFDQVIAASKEQSSIFKQMRFIQIETNTASEKTELRVIPDRITQQQLQREEQIKSIKNATEKQYAQTILDTERAIINILPMLAESMPVYSIPDLARPEIKVAALVMLEKNLESRADNLFSTQNNAEIMSKAAQVYDAILKDYAQNTIEIPRLSLQPEPPEAVFNDFDLNTTGQAGIESKFEFHVSDERVMRQDLVNHKVDYMGLLRGANEKRLETPENRIVNSLIDFSEVDYDKCRVLLFKLAYQAIEAIKNNMRKEETIESVVVENRKEIARRIYAQMKKHFVLQQSGYQISTIRPFSNIEKHNITVPLSAGRLDFTNEIPRARDIKQLVFVGFKKSSHPEYKFDSTSEQHLAQLLERDDSVEKWLRPAPRQFNIIWGNKSQKYEPDFVVETKEAMFLVEVKAANELDNNEVLQKATAAKLYCDTVSDYSRKHSKKEWHYLIIPHDKIQSNTTFRFICDNYKF
jgi:type III restriction enzyme